MAQAIKKDAKIYNLISVEDVMMREEKITGVVINWSSVEMAKLQVDPLSVKSKFVTDATGHAAEVARWVERKVGPVLFTETGRVIGEKPMWAELGENLMIENTKEVYHNLYVCGWQSIQYLADQEWDQSLEECFCQAKSRRTNYQTD